MVTPVLCLLAASALRKPAEESAAAPAPRLEGPEAEAHAERQIA